VIIDEPSSACTVESKKSPPTTCSFLTFFSQTVENFKSVFYTPIIRSYVC